MGKNADKRRARKQGHASPSIIAGEDAASDVVVTSLPGALPDPAYLPAPAWAARTLAPRWDLPDDDEGTLAHALLSLSSMLTTRAVDGALPSAVLTHLVQQIAALFDFDTVALCARAKDDDSVNTAAAFGVAPGAAGESLASLQHQLAQRAVAGQDLLSAADAPRDVRGQPSVVAVANVGSWVAVPLRVREENLGALVVTRREIAAFSPRDLDRLTVVAAWIAHDLAQTRQYFEATTDPLTGLQSRCALLTMLPRDVEIARRYQTPLSLMLLDVDDLAAINDAQGRVMGDAVLRHTAAQLASSMRVCDLLVRLGGDEFAAVLPMTPANQARALGKRLMRTLATPMDGISAPPRWSVAVATFLPQIDDDAGQFLRRCDIGLAQAKSQGGGVLVAAPQSKPGAMSYGRNVTSDSERGSSR